MKNGSLLLSARSMRVRIALFAVMLLGILAYGAVRHFALFTVPASLQPPRGATLLVHRSEGQPFFDSPDGACLRVRARPRAMARCRAAAVGLVDARNVMAHWRYMDWAYLRSTGGQRVGP